MKNIYINTLLNSLLREEGEEGEDEMTELMLILESHFTPSLKSSNEDLYLYKESSDVALEEDEIKEICEKLYSLYIGNNFNAEMRVGYYHLLGKLKSPSFADYILKVVPNMNESLSVIKQWFFSLEDVHHYLNDKEKEASFSEINFLFNNLDSLASDVIRIKKIIFNEQA